MPITPSDLTPEVRDILDKPTREGGCYSEQPVCQPDPRVTAQLTMEPPQRQVAPWRIGNAWKGDLIMCPGGPAGMIGGLLSQIHPPQYYSHMGIMTADGVEIRQAAANPDRVKQFYNGSILGVEEAPTDGIQEKALRFLWPGTLTLSAERAYQIWHGDDALKIKDNESGESFSVDNLTFGPVRMVVRGEWTNVYPLVVKPCPLLETPAVRAALHRVADAAKELRGHYRFFCYTHAAAGLDPWKVGPPMLETEKPDPASSCTGVKPLVPVRDGDTIPMVCSSFVWLAVRLVNDRAATANPPYPRIILDGRPQLPHFAAGGDYGRSMCNSFFPRQPAIDKINSQTPDGLYFYSKDEREDAAQWLYNYEVKTVRDELDKKLPGLLESLGIGAGVGLTVQKLLALLTSWNAGAVAALLGLTPLVLGQLVELTSDMPDDLANQICNAFAFDRCETTAKDDDNWKNPGVGYAVSPDNIINSWAPPTPHEDPAVIHGLYGYNQRLIPRMPEFVRDPPPPSTWQISQGFVPVRRGQVLFEGKGVHGASVRVGCVQFMTGPDGFFPQGQELPSGRYWAVAQYVHPSTNFLLESKGEVVTVPDVGGIELELGLLEPPDTRREVLIEGKMDLVNRYAIGEDWWAHPQFVLEPALIGLDYFPDEPEFAEQRKVSMAQPRGRQEEVDDWGQAELQCVIEIQKDRSIKISYKARLKNDDDDDWQDEGTFPVPPKANNADPGVSKVIDLVRSEMAWPVRAHIEFTVHNNHAP